MGMELNGVKMTLLVRLVILWACVGVGSTTYNSSAPFLVEDEDGLLTVVSYSQSLCSVASLGRHRELSS